MYKIKISGNLFLLCIWLLLSRIIPNTKFRGFWELGEMVVKVATINAHPSEYLVLHVTPPKTLRFFIRDHCTSVIFFNSLKLFVYRIKEELMWNYVDYYPHLYIYAMHGHIFFGVVVPSSCCCPTNTVLISQS